MIRRWRPRAEAGEPLSTILSSRILEKPFPVPTPKEKAARSSGTNSQPDTAPVRGKGPPQGADLETHRWHQETGRSVGLPGWTTHPPSEWARRSERL